MGAKFNFPRSSGYGYKARHDESEPAGRYRRGYDRPDDYQGRHRDPERPEHDRDLGGYRGSHRAPARSAGRHRAGRAAPPPVPTRSAWERLLDGETVHGYRLVAART
jgi:hypothetical protein